MKTINLLSPGQISENTGNSEQPKKGNKKKFFWVLLLIVFVLLPLYKIFYSSAPVKTATESSEYFHPTEETRPQETVEPVEKITTEAVISESESSLSASSEQVVAIPADTTDTVVATNKVVTPEKPVIVPEPISPKPAADILPEQALKTLEEVIPMEEREYGLLIGSFFSAKEAKVKMGKAAKLGADVYLETNRAEQETIVVYVGSFPDYAIAKETAECLQKDGFEIYLPKNQPQPYRIRLGIYKGPNYAQKIEKRLKDKGYEPETVKEAMPMIKHDVKTANFPTYQEAKEQQNLLKEKGVESILVLSRKKALPQ